MVRNVICAEQVLACCQVLLDTGATVSIVANKYFFVKGSIKKCKKRLFEGIGGGTLYSNFYGMTRWGSAYLCPDSMVNIISFGQSHNADHDLTLHDYGFNLDGTKFTKTPMGDGFLYIYHDNDYPIETFNKNTLSNRDIAIVFSKQQSQSDVILNAFCDGLTNDKRRRAKEAAELIRKLGYPSLKQVDTMIGGHITNTTLTRSDLSNALKAYEAEIMIPTIKGKTKAHPQVYNEIEFNRIVTQEEKRQILYGDIMFVNQLMFIVIVSLPLYLTITCHIVSKGKAGVIDAIERTIYELRQKGYDPQKLLWDGEKSIAVIKTALLKLGVEVGPNTSGQHIHVIERRIQTIKERARCILVSLPYALPIFLFEYLILFVIIRLNSLPVVTRPDGATPRELYTGKKLQMEDLKYGFGDYVLTYPPSTTNAIDEPRANGMIALYPSGDSARSWIFYDLASWSANYRNTKTVSRLGRYTLAHTTDVINKMNTMAGDEQVRKHLRDPTFSFGDDSEPVADPIMDYGDNVFIDELGPMTEIDNNFNQPMLIDNEIAINDDTNIDYDNNDNDNNYNTNEPSDNILHDQPEALVHNDHAIDAVPNDTISTTNIDNNINSNNIINDSDTTKLPAAIESGSAKSPRKSSRQKSKNSKYFNDDFISFMTPRKEFDEYIFSQLNTNKAIIEFGDQKTNEAAKIELQQLVDMETWHYPTKDERRKAQRINSHIVFKGSKIEKLTNQSSEDFKVKARMVARGDMQNESIYSKEDISSPTMSLQSLFMLIDLKVRERKRIITADVKGAYLNASMESSNPIMMRLNKFITNILLKIDPNAKSHINKDGTIDVILDKALYGCIESGKLWYNTISTLLLSFGYKIHPLDPCVFYKGEPGNQIFIGLYVDDLLIIYPEEFESQINNHLDIMENKYGKMKINRGNVHKYLGILFKFIDDDCFANMADYTVDILNEMPVVGESKYPASAHLLDINESCPKLSIKDKKLFHRVVAKLIYLTMRTRPEILLAVQFLTTRVQDPDMDDHKKLTKLLQYLQGTIDLGIKITSEQPLIPKAYIDSAHQTHKLSGKGQAGINITLGKGPIYASSSRVDLVTKSSTETELVAAADKCGPLFWVRNFLMDLGYEVGPAIIYQDNTSTISLIENGRSNSHRTKHIASKYFFLKDRIASGEIIIEYCPTELMIADILTKVLQGQLFLNLRELLLNWTPKDTLIFKNFIA